MSAGMGVPDKYTPENTNPQFSQSVSRSVVHKQHGPHSRRITTSFDQMSPAPVVAGSLCGSEKAWLTVSGASVCIIPSLPVCSRWWQTCLSCRHLNFRVSRNHGLVARAFWARARAFWARAPWAQARARALGPRPMGPGPGSWDPRGSRGTTHRKTFLRIGTWKIEHMLDQNRQGLPRYHPWENIFENRGLGK